MRSTLDDKDWFIIFNLGLMFLYLMVKTFDYYVKKSKEIHGDKYEYISLKK